MSGIKEHDAVALLVDIPEKGLRRGEVGTVIEVFDANKHHPSGCIVEFVAESGEVYAHANITNPEHLVQLHFKREAA